MPLDDALLIVAWSTYGLVLIMACAAFMFGGPRQSVRGARMFWPMLVFGVIMLFTLSPSTVMFG